MADDVYLAERAFDSADRLRIFSAAALGCGAVASFTGVARGASKAGEAVSGLFLDHHPRLTLPSMRQIADAAQDRFGIAHAQIVHRCGYVAAGEPIVFVAAASPHRRAALEAVDYIMDRLKTDAMFWKREDRGVARNGALPGPLSEQGEWIEPTEDDHHDRQRWRRGRT